MALNQSILLGLLLMVNAVEPVFRERLLFIFGNPENQLLVQGQLQLLADVPGEIKERDIKISVVPTGSSLYKNYQVKPGHFIVILVGKDGGEKYRSNKILQPAELFALIDAMPMRKAEMNQKLKED